MKISQIGEFGLIERLSQQLARREGVRLGIGDDCAVLEALSGPILTVDALVEEVHFRRDWTSPRALGRKAMAVNLSDLAASGARPVAALISLALGPNEKVEWIEELYAGFEDAARSFGFSIAGGDTVQSRGALVLSVALVGEVLDASRGPVLRSGAQVGDAILISGTLGDSAAGLALLQTPQTALSQTALSQTALSQMALSQMARDELLLRHHEPTPRLAVMRACLECDAQAIHAALDLSDGLVGDAAHLAKRSGVSVAVEAAALPISTACAEAASALGVSARDWALAGGEDYELCLAVAPARAAHLAREVKRKTGVALTKIGECIAPDASGPRVVVREESKEVAVSRAWTHF